MTDLFDNPSGDGTSLPSGGGLAVSGDALQVSGDGILASGDGFESAAGPSSGDSVIFGTESGGSDSLDLGSGDGVDVSGSGDGVSASVPLSAVTPAQRIPAPPKRAVPHVPVKGASSSVSNPGVLTRTEAKMHLRAWLEADLVVATGQSYTIGSRTLTRVDAAEIREMTNYWQALVSSLDEDGNVRRKTFRGIAMDF